MVSIKETSFVYISVLTLNEAFIKLSFIPLGYGGPKLD